MLVIGIVLAFAGAVLIVVPQLAKLEAVGWLLVVVGLVLVLYAALTDDGSKAFGYVGAMAIMAPPLGTPRPRPVMTAFLIAAVPITAAFILQVADLSGIDTPLVIRTALTGAGGLTAALAGAWSQAKVTPLEDPRDDNGRPLVIAPEVVSTKRKPTSRHRPPKPSA